ncbi:hypothetical protein F2Q68_00024354 [Brassica cretica]|uniref:Uncharacterized protein n=1 Tax=Brassica cretica TaxID=69181 RepID=A0A8S9IEQ6_BRACR|nr:hypothetical protein F2Q68_00024354 [Brassica cretica]
MFECPRKYSTKSNFISQNPDETVALSVVLSNFFPRQNQLCVSLVELLSPKHRYTIGSFSPSDHLLKRNYNPRMESGPCEVKAVVQWCWIGTLARQSRVTSLELFSGKIVIFLREKEEYQQCEPNESFLGENE